MIPVKKVTGWKQIKEEEKHIFFLGMVVVVVVNPAGCFGCHMLNSSFRTLALQINIYFYFSCR